MWTLGSRVAPCSWTVASKLATGLPAWPWRLLALALLWGTPCILPALKSQYFSTSKGHLHPSWNLLWWVYAGVTHADRIRLCSEFSHSYFFFKPLPQEGAIFLFNLLLNHGVRILWIHHAPGEQEMMDVSPGQVSLHAHTLPTKAKSGPWRRINKQHQQDPMGKNVTSGPHWQVVFCHIFRREIAMENQGPSFLQPRFERSFQSLEKQWWIPSYLTPAGTWLLHLGTHGLEKGWAPHPDEVCLMGLCVARMSFSHAEPSCLIHLHFGFRYLTMLSLKMPQCLKCPRAPVQKPAVVQRQWGRLMWHWWSEVGADLSHKVMQNLFNTTYCHEEEEGTAGGGTSLPETLLWKGGCWEASSDGYLALEWGAGWVDRNWSSGENLRTHFLFGEQLM